MSDPSTAFLPAIRHLRSDEKKEQSVSFIIGASNTGGGNFSRSAVTYSLLEQNSTMNAPDEELIDTISKLYDFMLDFIHINTQEKHNQAIITPSLIKKLHELSTNTRLHNDIGKYRAVDVLIYGSNHKPPSAFDIEKEIIAFCDYINNSRSSDPFYLAAFVLWKLNWIHPFVDGNGRVARVLSYIILSLGLGGVLPGIPTVLEQLANHRDQYYNALRVADNTFETTGEQDLNELRNMLKVMLLRQIGNIASFPEEEEEKFKKIFQNRILRAPAKLLNSRFGTNIVSYRFWAYRDLAVLQVGPASSINDAEFIHLKLGEVFPGLFPASKDLSMVALAEGSKGFIISNVEIRDLKGSGIFLERNSAVIVESPIFYLPAKAGKTDKDKLLIQGALYAFRYGREVNSFTASETIDFLIARHMSLDV